MIDLVDLAARVTQSLPERAGASIGYRVSQRASRKTRIARLRTGGRVAADVGDHLHRQMFFRGEYEPGVTRFMASVVRPGWGVVDVGANVGYFSVLAADLGGINARIIAFEPHPTIAGMLALTARHNPEADIAVCEAACGSTAGTATLYVSPEDRNSGLGTLCPMRHGTDGVTVRVVRVDHACQEHMLIPDFIKIDAEGFELDVLKGCGRLLEHRIPEYFVIELAPSRDDPSPLIELLMDSGYDGFRICRDGSLSALTVTDLSDNYDDTCFVRR